MLILICQYLVLKTIARITTPMKLNNQSGISLVEIMVGIGLLGGISLAVMQLSKNASTSQAQMSASVDFIDLQNELQGILSNPKDCMASFKNTAFYGTSIKTIPVPLEIWLGDQAGVRTRKRFSATDANFKSIGKITISDISFTMPDYTLGTNFAPGPGSFKGTLQVNGTKKIMGKDTTTKKITKLIHFSFDTDGAGKSVISSCSLQVTSQTAIPKQGFCTPIVNWDNSNVATCPAISGYATTRISACIPSNYRTITCCYVPSNEDSNGWCSDPMEGHSGCFSGCGAGSANYTVDHINGVSSGKNDTHICCFIPKDSTVTKPILAPAVSQWDSFSGCNSHTGYDSIRIEAVTGGKGHESSCSYIPK
jgi:hypothetical protein